MDRHQLTPLILSIDIDISKNKVYVCRNDSSQTKRAIRINIKSNQGNREYTAHTTRLRMPMPRPVCVHPSDPFKYVDKQVDRHPHTIKHQSIKSIKSPARLSPSILPPIHRPCEQTDKLLSFKFQISPFCNEKEREKKEKDSA